MEDLPKFHIADVTMNIAVWFSPVKLRFSCEPLGSTATMLRGSRHDGILTITSRLERFFVDKFGKGDVSGDSLVIAPWLE
jgi:hypothetical protein